MSQSQGLATCPICLSSMNPEGDHKMCTLKCGHLFGFLCIIQCLENKSECPICRQRATIDDIIPLIWDDQISSNEIINQLNKEKDQLLQNQQSLVEELKSVKLELNSTKDELSQANLFSSQLSNQNSRSKSNSAYSSTSAAVIYERKVNDAFRLLVSNNQLFVSQKTGSKYGIQISSISTLNSSYFISIHDGQIRDISNSPDFSIIATASIDKSICIVNSRTTQVINRFNVSEPLWSCCWASRNILAAGGNCGKLFIRDIRASNTTIINNSNRNSNGSIYFDENSVFQMAPGPPLFSVLPLNTTRLLCISPVIGRYFDLRNGKFEPNSKNIEGGQLACYLHNNYSSSTSSSSQSSPNHSFSISSSSSNNSNLIMVTSRDQAQSAKSVYYNMKSDGLLHAVRARENKYFSLISRQALVRCGGSIYSICPDETINDFSVFSNNKNDEDIWAKWRLNFPASAHPSPVLDGFATEYSSSQLMIFSLSSSLLRVNTLRV